MIVQQDGRPVNGGESHGGDAHLEAHGHTCNLAPEQRGRGGAEDSGAVCTHGSDKAAVCGRGEDLLFQGYVPTVGKITRAFGSF